MEISYSFDAHKAGSRIFRGQPKKLSEFVEIPITLFLPIAWATPDMEEKVRGAMRKVIDELNDNR